MAYSRKKIEFLVGTIGHTPSARFRFHFVSATAWSNEDVLWPTTQGAVTVDNLSLNGGAAETFEGAACNAQTVGAWKAFVPPAFGEYGELHHGATFVQEDPCNKALSNLWGWYDDPAVTNYACGGWPLQGAMPYGPDANGLYMLNEVWSPFFPITGSGTEFILSFLTYAGSPAR